MLEIKKNTKKRTKIKNEIYLNEKKHKLTYENEKKPLKNIRRRIFYRLQTSANVKRH
jgi:hypothetical protein